MDAARSVLMLLGVVLHVACVYCVRDLWVIRDPNGSLAFDYLRRFIHQFRVPSFFLISGFFAHFMLRKYGSRQFLKRRLTRIGVPLVVVGLFFNSTQRLLLGNAPAPALLSAQYWLGQTSIQHLWFLVNILIYSLLAALLWRPWVPRRNMLDNFLASPPMRRGAAIEGTLIFCLPFALLLWHAILNATPVVRRFGPVDLADLGDGGVYFGLGLLLYGWPVGCDRFMNPDKRFFAIWIPAALLAGTASAVIGDTPRGLALRAALLFLNTVARIGLVRIVLSLFRWRYDYPSRVFHYLANSTYTVYLVHHLFVVVLGLLLIPVEMPAVVKFVLVCSATTAAAFAFHHLAVLRFPWLEFLMNGRFQHTIRGGAIPTMKHTAALK